MRHNIRNINRTLICLTAVCLLASCKIGQQYTRPDIDIPKTLADEESTDSASIADLSWTEVYTDTILQKHIRNSLTYNKDMLMSAARVKELA